MEIHHAMIVRSSPSRLYQALTQQRELQVWMDAPTMAIPEVGSIIEFQYDQGRRTMKMEISHLDVDKQVKWRVIQALWSNEAVDQTITWTLSMVEDSTLVDFRMEGWKSHDAAFASISYKWALFMVRLKISMGDTREIASLLSIDAN